MASYVVDGCTGINDDALICGNQFGGSATNGFFFSKLMSVPGSECEFVSPRIHNSGPAMRSLYIANALQNIQITANCRKRSADLLGNLLKRREFNPLQIFGDAMLALFRLHLSVNMIYCDRFCKIYLTIYHNLSKWRSYACSGSITASGCGGTPRSPSGISAIRQAVAEASNRAESARGKCKCATLPLDPRHSGNSFRKRASAHGSQMALPGRPICGEGDADADWAAQPGYFKSPDFRSVPNLEPG